MSESSELECSLLHARQTQTLDEISLGLTEVVDAHNQIADTLEKLTEYVNALHQRISALEANE